jgi:hypothetical protein
MIWFVRYKYNKIIQCAKDQAAVERESLNYFRRNIDSAYCKLNVMSIREPESDRERLVHHLHKAIGEFVVELPVSRFNVSTSG